MAAACCPAISYGQAVEWASGFGDVWFNKAAAVAVDQNGNTYVTGDFMHSITIGSFTFNAPGNDIFDQDGFVAKFDPAGNVLWARHVSSQQLIIPGPARDDGGQAIAVDAAGNCYVAGFFRGEITFGPFTLSAGDLLHGPWLFLVKYDTNGNVIWARERGFRLAHQRP